MTTRYAQLQEQKDNAVENIVRTTSRYADLEERSQARRATYHLVKDRRAFWLGFAIITGIPFGACVIANTSTWSLGVSRDVPGWVVGFLGAAALIAIVGLINLSVKTSEAHNAWQYTRDEIVAAASRAASEYRWYEQSDKEMKLIDETVDEAVAEALKNRAVSRDNEAQRVSERAQAAGKSGFIATTPEGFVPVEDVKGARF